MQTLPISKEELIIRLLIEDYRFQQITHHMRLINFHFDQSLDLMSIIAQLITGNSEEPDVAWLHAYAQGLEAVYRAGFWDQMVLESIARSTYSRLI